jgi:hypothetical protein
MSFKTAPQPLPEPKPDMMFIGGKNQQAQSTAASSGSGGGKSLPSISSSNGDNFYTVFSQISYNVIV